MAIAVFSQPGDVDELFFNQSAQFWWLTRCDVKRDDALLIYVGKDGIVRGSRVAEITGGKTGFWFIALALSDATKNDVINPTGDWGGSAKDCWVQIGGGQGQLIRLERPLTLDELRADPLLSEWQFTKTKGASSKGTKVEVRTASRLLELIEERNPSASRSAEFARTRRAFS